MVVDADAESGSLEFKRNLKSLSSRIGHPSLVICTDSCAGSYDQLWMTSSLRGLLTGTLKIKNLNQPISAGDGAGIVPETFRIMRQILDRIDDPNSGACNRVFQVTIPGKRYTQAEEVSKVIGEDLIKKFPWTKGSTPVDRDPFVSYLNRTWRPSLVVTGIDGLPCTNSSSLVMRPETDVKLALFVPPTLDANFAMKMMHRLCEENPPNGAETSFTECCICPGFNSPVNDLYLDDCISRASLNFFEKPALQIAEGHTIPMLNVLQT